MMVSSYWEAVGMENTPEHPLFREDRKAQTLVKRIEKKQASQAAAREAETKGTLEEYGKRVGSYLQCCCFCSQKGNPG
jgi:hypothetical protein